MIDYSKTPAETAGAHNDKPSFWLLHIMGWVAYVIIFSFDNILFTKATDVGFSIILPLIFSGTVAAILTLPLRSIYQRCWQLTPKQLVIVIVAASLIVALIWTPIKNIGMWFSNDKASIAEWFQQMSEGEINPWGILTSLSYAFFMVLVWSSLYFGINYHYRLMHEKKLHLHAVRLSHFAQIKMLRYQINPHFLFNTLNAISTLVLQGNKEKANGMLVRLSTFLRFSLDNDPEKKVALYDEIKASMLYLEIEKTRFEDRLKVDLRIAPETEALLVPSLLLQPLIENSIKYAIANMASGGEIKIHAYCDNQYLHLSVADNGTGVIDPQKESPETKPQEHQGVGIQNIRDRLAVLYPNEHSFETSKNSPRGYKVDISLPMEKP